MKTLDLTTDTQIDIMINKNRDLNSVIHFVWFDNEGNEHDFDFVDYNTAMLHVKNKPDNEYVVLTMSTISGTLQFEDSGRMRFKLTPEESNVRAGEYYYDLYLYGTNYDKRQLLSGKFIIKETVTN